MATNITHQRWHRPIIGKYQKIEPKPAKPPEKAEKPKKQKQPEPHDFTRIDVYQHKLSVALMLSVGLIILGVLTTVIVFGATGQVFKIRSTSILGINVDPDLQLALIGLLNKIMDLLLTACLEYFALVYLTLKMSSGLWSGQQRGVRISDLTVAKELTNPFYTVTAFVKRCKFVEWKTAGLWSVLRFVLCLILSTCVLLQGLAINTLGIPKERWYPSDSRAVPVTHPIPQFIGQGLDWGNFWQRSWDMVRGGLPSWHVADGLIVSSTFLAFQSFRPTMLGSTTGWQQFGNQTDYYPALDTGCTGSSARGMAVQSRVIVDIYNFLHQHGDSNANASMGWTGMLSLEFPSTTVICGDYSPLQGTGTIVVPSISDDETPRSWYELSIAPMNISTILYGDLTPEPFSGVNCNITFRRLSYPVKFWIVDGASTASVSVNNYGQSKNYGHPYKPPPAIPVPHQPIDDTITQRLSVQTQATVARLETLNTNITAAQLFVQLARNFALDRADYRNATDAVSLAPVIALLTNQLLASADWNITYSWSYNATSTPIIWQLFGSGPRLPWEWATSSVLGVLLTAVLLVMIVLVKFPIKPGSWFEVGGMMVAASQSSRMKVWKNVQGKDAKELERSKFWLRRVEDGVAEIADEDGGSGGKVDLKREWKWPG